MSTSSRVLKNSAFLYIRIGLTMFVSLWTTRIVFNALGVDDFAIYSLVGGVVALLGFLNASLSSSTQRFINFAEGKDDLLGKINIFNNSLCLHFLLGIILVALFLIIGFICFSFELLDIPHSRLFAAKIVYGCVVATTLLSVMNVPYEAMINAHEDMEYYVYIGILEVVFKLVIAYLMTIAHTDRLILYTILMATVPLVTLTLMKIYCHKNYTECVITPIKCYDKKIIKELGTFSGWNLINSASGVATQNGFSIVLNHYYGVVLNAAQGLAMQVGGVLFGISSNAMKALNPIIVKSESQHKHEKMLYVSLLGCRISYFIFTLLSIPLVALMSDVLYWWLKEVPPYAVIFCQLQLVRLSTNMLTYGLETSIMAQGNIRMFNIVRSAINILPIIIVIAAFRMQLAPYWMYIIWIIGWSVLGGFVTLYFANTNTGLSYCKYLFEVLIPAVVITVFASIIIYISKYISHSQLTYLFGIIIAEVAFVILSWMYLFQKTEKQGILLLFNKVIKKIKWL